MIWEQVKLQEDSGRRLRFWATGQVRFWRQLPTRWPGKSQAAKERVLVALTKIYFLFKNNQRSHNQVNAFIILALKTFVSILTFFLAYLKTSLKGVIRSLVFLISFSIIQKFPSMMWLWGTFVRPLKLRHWTWGFLSPWKHFLMMLVHVKILLEKLNYGVLLKQLESMPCFYNCGPETLIISWRST